MIKSIAIDELTETSKTGKFRGRQVIEIEPVNTRDDYQKVMIRTYDSRGITHCDYYVLT